MRIAIAALLALALGLTARAEEQPVELQKAKGVETVEGNCAACHSLDYIKMNSPFLSPAGWDAEVHKMITSYGAPIESADAKSIADYLKANYGGESPVR